MRVFPEMASEMEQDTSCYGIIGNIPPSYHSADLRNYFSQFIETDGFECFHFRHRPEGRRRELPGDPHCEVGQASSSSRTELSQTSKSAQEKVLSRLQAFTNTLPKPKKTATDKTKQPLCCVVKLKKSKMPDLLKMYHRKHWLDKNGDSIPALCFISRIKVTGEDSAVSTYMTRKERQQIPEDRETFTQQHLKSLIELKPPDIMPKGNVGTPTRVFLQLIQECRLPPSVIKKLGLVFPKTRSKRRYGDVPYDYGGDIEIVDEEFEEDVLTRMGQKIEKEDSSAASRSDKDENAECDEVRTSGSESQSETTTSMFKKPSVSDQPNSQKSKHSRKRTRDKGYQCREKKAAPFGNPTKQKHISSENIERVDDDDYQSGSDSDGGEEWDRHDANYDDASNQSRLKERAFEEELEIVWEKGGSGLVFYTDEMVWRQKQGDFDEQTADDWDVDMSGYYDSGAGDKDARDFLDMRREQRLRAGIEDDRLANDPAIGKFERYTKGIGRRVLERQGWKEGQGVGQSVEGMSDALDNDGQAPTDKRGFGYHGEKIQLLAGPASKRPRRKPGDAIISTIFDDPGETDANEPLLRRNELSTLKYRHNFKFVKASDSDTSGESRTIPQTMN